MNKISEEKQWPKLGRLVNCALKTQTFNQIMNRRTLILRESWNMKTLQSEDFRCVIKGLCLWSQSQWENTRTCETIVFQEHTNPNLYFKHKMVN